MSRFLLMRLIVVLGCVLGANGIAASAEPTPIEIFNQRIMPIFRSAQPSSCVQCHLASVDLKSYILPSHEKTFASLRDQGLIDLSAPKDSKILTLIRMGQKDLDKGARLIHEKTRRAEYEAFAAWIEACCADPAIRNLAKLTASEIAKPAVSNEVIRHARKSRVVDSFARNVWSQRMRCFPCHTPHEIDASNPRQQAALKTRRQFKEKLSAEQFARLDFFRETPEATLDYLIERSRNTPAGELPLINLENPRQSLLVLKPTAKLLRKRDDGTFEAPTYTAPVSHLGGLKMHPDDHSYKAFVTWMQDYANVVDGRYASVDDLPADNWNGTMLVLRVTETPESWAVGVPVQLFVHSWNAQDKAWGTQPVAFTQGTVTPRKIVNGSLFMLTSTVKGEPPTAARKVGTLPRGKYLVKAYVDTRGRLTDDPALLLDEKDYFGEAELKSARWREGFRQAEKLSGKSLQRD
jgi:hypothetical protein